MSQECQHLSEPQQQHSTDGCPPIGDIYYCPPKNLTIEEIQLYDEKIDECTTNSGCNTVQRNWNSLAAIFNTYAMHPDQFQYYMAKIE